MGIKGAFVVPHPPIIVEEVGHRREAAAERIISAYMEVAREIEAIAPDTIIITSPHTEMYSDYFHIADGVKGEGDFGEFGASQVKVEAEYDWEFCGELAQLLEEKEFPGGTLGGKSKKLDHGVMVPLYFIQKKYSDFKLVRIGLSGLSYETHYALGEYISEIAEKLGRNCVFVASGDLSHRLLETGPYGFRKEGPEYDSRIMESLEKANFLELFEYPYQFCEKAGECGHKSFLIMAGALNGLEIEAKKLAYEGPYGVGYGICSFYPGRKNQTRNFGRIRMEQLGNQSEGNHKGDSYTDLARQSLEYYFRMRKPMPLMETLPKELLNERAGAFVSLKKFGQLRGCIGTISPTAENLGEEIIQNAISAAMSDPRFSPVSEQELKDIMISVDVLGRAHPIESTDQLDVKRYGVIVTNGCRRGLLLPDLEGVDTVEEQVAIAKRKAGIAEDEEVSIQRFEVIRHCEREV
ncbi:MAG: AmmeMemoRadiSam system protein A [Lachnospiraceae bacterium]|nr:AmmeMemoRadiSam system protein A [Lachnospiraceae bacterium]